MTKRLCEVIGEHWTGVVIDGPDGLYYCVLMVRTENRLRAISSLDYACIDLTCSQREATLVADIVSRFSSTQWADELNEAVPDTVYYDLIDWCPPENLDLIPTCL